MVVPIRDEEHALEDLLDSLLRQEHRPDEIVLADGGSKDATVEIARRYSSRGVRVLEIGPAYPGRGRNAGIGAARNDWVGLVDAGCRAAPGWLRDLVSTAGSLASPGIVYGDFRPELLGPWDVAQALAFVGPYDPSARVHPPFIASSLLHRQVWQRAQGFPEHLRAGEDLLFMRRVQSLGVPILRCPSAVVHWRLAAGPAAVFRRFRLYSAHHLAAGLSGTWHRRVWGMDVAGLALLVFAMRWPAALAVAAVAGLARVLRTVHQRRFNVDAGAFRPDRLLRVAVLLAVADAATWVGTLDYLRGRGPRR